MIHTGDLQIDFVISSVGHGGNDAVALKRCQRSISTEASVSGQDSRVQSTPLMH